MKRARMLGVALAALLAPASLRAQAIPVRPAGELSSLVGLPFDVPITADMTARTERLGSFALRLTWDPAVLRLDAGVPGSFGGVSLNTDSVADGVLRMAGANPSGAAGLVTLGIARFTPISGGTTPLGLTLSELYSSGSFADLLPSAVVSGGSYCPALGRFGDVDDDGTANSRDALIALSNAVGLDVSAFDIALGDVDGNGATNARDALIILSYAVGLDVSGFRVLRLAGGACAANAPLTMSVTPSPLDLVLGQSAQLEARAANGSGALQSLPDVVWKSSAPGVAAVTSDGRVLARSEGAAVITALRGFADSAQATITVIPGRTLQVVDAAAVNATNQLGSAALPFASLQQAAAAVAPGDTVRVLPGRYGESVTFTTAVVILGQRVGGATAVVAAFGDTTGLTLNGRGVSEVHDLAIEGFRTALKIGSVDTVVVDSLRVLARGGTSTCFTAGILIQEAWLLVVRRSQLVGDGSSGCASGIVTSGTTRVMVVEDAAVTDFGYAGIYAGGSSGSVDSLVVRRSTISDNDGYGIYAYAYPYNSGRIPPSSSVALVVEDSRFVDNNYEPLYVYDLRSALIARSFIDTRAANEDALNLYGIDSAYVRLVGDSILVDDYDWFYGYGFDSVTVDLTRVVGAYYGDLDGVDYVRVTNSSFTQSTGGSLLYVYPNRLSTATIVVDSVTASGDGSCGQCMEFIDASSAQVSVNRLRLDDFDYGIDTGDSSITVTNSVFTNGYQGIYAYSNATPRPRLEVRQVTMTGVYYGIESYNMVTVVDSVTLTGTAGEYEGVYTYGGGADTVRFSAVTGYEYGIDLEDSAGYAANNTMLRPTYDAFYFSGNGTAADSAVMVNNTVTCDAYGAENAGGVDAYSSNMRFEGNTVTGCNWGLYIESGSTGLGVKVRGNTISIPPVADYSGIWVGGPYRSEIVGNVVTGGAPYADGNIYLRGYSYAHTPFARVDSNTVQQAQVWGIRLEYVDSVEVRGNLVEDVSTPCCFTNPGGIALYGNTRYRARITGNTLRRVHGAAIAITQFDTATVVLDTNAISAADTAAVRVTQGSLTMRGNNVRNNAIDGVRIEEYFWTYRIHGNAFKGNGRYAVVDNSALATVDADSNWWGANGIQPGGVGADSVLGVTDTLPLAAEPTGLPPLAPPVLRPVVGVASVAGVNAGRAAPSASAASHRTRAERLAQRATRLQAESAAAAQRPSRHRPLQAPSVAMAARVQRQEAVVRTEAARAAEGVARDSVRADRRAQRAQARRAGP
jgi:hypothetical protein